MGQGQPDEILSSADLRPSEPHLARKVRVKDGFAFLLFWRALSSSRTYNIRSTPAHSGLSTIWE